MDTAAKLIERRGGGLIPKPPLSVILERSAEDARALSEISSRPSSSTNSIDWDKELGPPVKLSGSFRIPAAEPKKNDGPPPAKAPNSFNMDFGDGSFVSLSESQAKDLFDNDVKDRIEFLGSENNIGDGFNNTLGTSRVSVNESLGAYFMRRSSNPVKGMIDPAEKGEKGISEESTFLRSHFLESTFSQDFDNSRSVSASTPLPNKSSASMIRCSNRSRRRTAYGDEDSYFQPRHELANESLADLRLYLQGAESDGRRKESMIDHVLKYCRERTKENIKPEVPKVSNPSNTASHSVPKRSPVQLDIAPAVANLDERRAKLSAFKLAEPQNDTKIIKRSTTHLNVTMHEKSVILPKKKTSTLLPRIPSSQYSQVGSSNQNHQVNQLAPVTQDMVLAGTHNVSSVSSAATTASTCSVYPNYQFPSNQPMQNQPSQYGFPLVIQVFCPYPGAQMPYNQPNMYQQLPQGQYATQACMPLQHAPQAHMPPQHPQFMYPSTQGQQTTYVAPSQNPPLPQCTSSTNVHPSLIPAEVTLPECADSTLPNKMPRLRINSEPVPEKHELLRPVREKTMHSSTSSLPQACANEEALKVVPPVINIDKLAIVWQGCSVGSFATEKLVLYNQENYEINLRCCFPDSITEEFLMVVARPHGAQQELVPRAKTSIRANDQRVIKIAYKPKTNGRAIGKLRLEFSKSDSLDSLDRKQRYASYIPLVGFGYGETSDEPTLSELV